MQNNDWIKTGEDILHSVLEAVEQQDYSDLSKKIENKINDAIGTVSAKINESTQKYSSGQSTNTTQEWIRAKQEKERAAQQKAQQEALSLQLYRKNPPGTYSGIVCKVIGVVGTFLFGIAAFVLTVIALLTSYVGIWLADIIVGGFFAGSIALLGYGVKTDSFVKRFKNYVKQIGNKQYCKIEELAKTVGKKTRFVEKEVREMINRGFFLQGHMDHTGSTLITSNDMYDKYLQAEQARKNRELEETRLARLKAENSIYSVQVQQILEEGNRYIQHIHECNDAIPGEVMSRKLETLEDIMKRIFELLKKHPESSDDLQKLMKYYLPTTTKLIDAYKEIDGQPSYGQNHIANTKKEIEDTLDVINAAFGKLFDDMYEETAWDISADISTMKTMLAKEGLTGGKDFSIG